MVNEFKARFKVKFLFTIFGGQIMIVECFSEIFSLHFYF